MSGRAKTSANDWHTRQTLEAARAAYVAEFGPECQLCGTVPKTRGLQWDHDHKTGAHRGWLCHRCNRALPNWVTVRWLLLAAAYLAKDDPAHVVVVSAEDCTVSYLYREART